MTLLERAHVIGSEGTIIITIVVIIITIVVIIITIIIIIIIG